MGLKEEEKKETERGDDADDAYRDPVLRLQPLSTVIVIPKSDI